MTTKEENTFKNGLTDGQVAVQKVMFILFLLHQVKINPDKYPEKEGRVIYSKHHKQKALSKEEILAYQNHNQSWMKMDSEEFDLLIPMIVPFMASTYDINNKPYYLLFI